MPDQGGHRAGRRSLPHRLAVHSANLDAHRLEAGAIVRAFELQRDDIRAVRDDKSRHVISAARLDRP